MAGRPTKLTAEVLEQIVAGFRQGKSCGGVAQELPIHVRSLERWIQRGKAEPESRYGEICAVFRETARARRLRATTAMRRRHAVEAVRRVLHLAEVVGPSELLTGN